MADLTRKCYVCLLHNFSFINKNWFLVSIVSFSKIASARTSASDFTTLASAKQRKSKSWSTRQCTGFSLSEGKEADIAQLPLSLFWPHNKCTFGGGGTAADAVPSVAFVWSAFIAVSICSSSPAGFATPCALSQSASSSRYNTSSTPYFNLKSAGEGYLCHCNEKQL